MAKQNGISRKLLISGLLCLITFAAFWPLIRCGFVNFDDPEYVIDQPYVLGGLTWRGVIWAFTSQQASNWHPLTGISHMLDVQLFGVQPLAHHLVNLLFHSASTILLFLLLNRITSTLWRSGVVAALFAVHPLHVESVAWISERKDVLSTLFWLLVIWEYCEYAKKKSEARTSDSTVPKGTPTARIAYSLALLFFALGLMSKAMIVTLPFVLLLLDYWPLGRFKNSPILPKVLEKIPFFVMSAAASIITYEVQHAQGATRFSGELPMTARAENALVSYIRYLGKTFWPADLAVFYPHPSHWPISMVGVASLIILGITALALWMRVKGYLPVGWFWFLGTLVPVIGLVQVGDQAMADRYMYIPSIGLFVAIVWSLGDLVRRSAAFTRTAKIIGIVIICILSIGTHRLTRTWQNSETLFQHALAVDKNNPAAHNFLGSALASQGRFKEAESHFAEALRIRPDFPYAQINYGVALASDGKTKEGALQLMELLKKRPNDEEVRYSLGIILQQGGNIAGAIDQYQEALRLKPDDADSLNNLAWIRAANSQASFRNGEEAVHLAQRACELTRFQKPVMIGTLAAAYAEAGRFNEAISAAQKAQTIAQALRQAETAARNSKLMELYQAGRAYHEPD